MSMINFERVEVPTSLNKEQMNCYLLGGDELALVDLGPAIANLYDNLTADLIRTGYSIKDVADHPYHPTCTLITVRVALQIKEETEVRGLDRKDAAMRVANPIVYL